jgi:hypothetical protein
LLGAFRRIGVEDPLGQAWDGEVVRSASEGYHEVGVRKRSSVGQQGSAGKVDPSDFCLDEPHAWRHDGVELHMHLLARPRTGSHARQFGHQLVIFVLIYKGKAYLAVSI